MERSSFENLVSRALLEIPAALRTRITNVDIVVENAPTREQFASTMLKDGEMLLGLYEGIPLTEREDYGMVLPDKISLFQDSIEAVCASDEEIVEEVRETVVHEVAHHFGISDEALDAMER